MTPERAAMLTAKAEARKRAWSVAAHEKRKITLAARAISEGREPGKIGSVKRFTTDELKQHQQQRDAKRDRAKCRASARASMAKLYKKDPARFIERARQNEERLLAENPKVLRLSQAARRSAYRARQHGAVSERGLSAAIRRVWAASGGKCAACSATDNLELDHVQAIANGGTNDELNLQFLCQPCNRSKGKKDYKTWLQGHTELEGIAA